MAAASWASWMASHSHAQASWVATAASDRLDRLLQRSANRDQAEDRILRESEALLALLQNATKGEGRHGGHAQDPLELQDLGLSVRPHAPAADVLPPAMLPPTSHQERYASPPAAVGCMASAAQPAAAESTQLLEVASVADIAQLRTELNALLGNANLPLGTAVWDFVDAFRRSYGTQESADSHSQPAAAAATSVAVPAASLPTLQHHLARWWRSQPSVGPTAHTSQLPLAVACVRSTLFDIEGKLAGELPEALQQDPRALAEGRVLLEAMLHRAIYPTLSALYAAHHTAEIAALARTCHTMRSLLPCDMLLPPSLWLVEPGRRAAPNTSLGALAEPYALPSGCSGARLAARGGRGGGDGSTGCGGDGSTGCGGDGSDQQRDGHAGDSSLVDELRSCGPSAHAHAQTPAHVRAPGL